MSAPSSRATATGAEELESLLERLGESSALADGRAFVDGRRASREQARFVPPAGSVVEVYAARPHDRELAILRVADGLAFVDKPPGLATEPEKRGASTSLVHLVATALGVEASTVHALSRLDVGVSGVVLLGLDAAAQRRVQVARERGEVRRRYVAIAAGTPAPAEGDWSDPIGKGRGPLRAVRPDGEPAHTHYRVCGSAARGPTRASALALDPSTGRTHQLRVHAAFHGAPLFGDKSYGGPARVVSGAGAVSALGRVFLHAAWIALPGIEPVEAALPDEFSALWSSLGGDLEALANARDPSVADERPAR